jgi:putative hydrolase of the HAD superfamily
MKKPKMILFDYGQTLINESVFNGLAGQKALLNRAIKNGSGATAEEINNFVEELEKDIGRYNLDTVDSYKYEIHNFNFQRYINEYFELEFNMELWELEKIFWDNASPAAVTEGIEELLRYLDDNTIRTGVISNISFGEDSLKERINELIPTNHFEFIMATSDYVFRKPSKYIFQFALKKAGLKPEEVWYCGDNPAYDVDGSVNAGMTGVWYTGAIRHKSAMPKSNHIHIENWRELIDMLNNPHV